MTTPDAVVRAWFEELWNQGREDTIDRLFATNGLAHGLAPDGQPVRGPEGYRPFFRQFRAAFPDLRVSVERTVTEGDTVAAHCRVTGNHHGDGLGARASGKSVEFWGMTIVRVRDGQIVEAWNSFDFLSLYQQIGLMPRLPQ